MLQNHNNPSLNPDDISVSDLLSMLSNITNQSQPTHDPKPTPSNGHRILEVKDEWVKDIKCNDDKSKSTIISYEANVRHFAKWTDCRFVEQVEVAEIVSFKNHMIQDKDLKPNS